MEVLKNAWEESPEFLKIALISAANILFGMGLWAMYF